MITMNNEAPEREEIETLLPWFAAGTLNRRDSCAGRSRSCSRCGAGAPFRSGA